MAGSLASNGAINQPISSPAQAVQPETSDDPLVATPAKHTAVQNTMAQVLAPPDTSIVVGPLASNGTQPTGSPTQVVQPAVSGDPFMTIPIRHKEVHNIAVQALTPPGIIKVVGTLASNRAIGQWTGSPAQVVQPDASEDLFMATTIRQDMNIVNPASHASVQISATSEGHFVVTPTRQEKNAANPADHALSQISAIIEDLFVATRIRQDMSVANPAAHALTQISAMIDARLFDRDSIMWTPVQHRSMSDRGKDAFLLGDKRTAEEWHSVVPYEPIDDGEYNNEAVRIS